MSTKEADPAYPYTTGNNQSGMICVKHGLTKLEFIATQIATGLATDPAYVNANSENKIAKKAVSLAQKLIEELDKT